MITKAILFLFVFQFAFAVTSGEIITITGFVESVNKKTLGTSVVKIRTAKEDIVLNFDKLDKETKKALISKDSHKIKHTFKIDQAAVIERKNTPMGIRADCSEMPTDMNELEDIAKNSDDMLDFLKKIPEGSLQGFTFVTNSLSLHRGQKDENGEGQVSPMWPRVLRSSIDGKITISFVCDPKNPTFGKVEIIHFDSNEKEFKTTEFDFGHPKKEKIKPKDRIHHDPVSCISCHAGSEINGKASLKPNWPQYFQWSDCKEDRGINFYGGNDDNMGPDAFRNAYDKKDCTDDEIKKSTNLEKDNYLKFRELQKNNECFNSLPWPDESKDQNSFQSKWSYKYYPYAETSQEKNTGSPENAEESFFNYSLRTNLRFTDTYSHLMSQRIANLLTKNPDYDAIKYLLVMEQADCNIDKELKQLSEVMPNFKHGIINGSFLSVEAPLLSQFSDYVGLSRKDWTMEFQEKDQTSYRTGVPGFKRFDLRIFNMVGGEILKDIGKSNQTIAEVSKDKLTRAVERDFGSNFRCIDDLGGGIKYTDESRISQFIEPSLCDSLRKENAKNFKKIKEIQASCIDCNKLNAPKDNEKSNEDIEVIVSKLTDEQISRGKKLVELDSKGKCVMCHSAGVDMLPKDFRFIPSEADKNKAESVAILKARKDEIAGKIEYRLIKTKTMPPMENELTDQDREDIKAYILSVAKSK